MNINFRNIYSLLKKWFDEPTPEYDDFKCWRFEKYEELELGKRKNLPLKTWWPKYTEGDFRLELALGAMLVQQVRWAAVRQCIENLNRFLIDSERLFDLEGILSIPLEKLEELIRPCRYKRQKGLRILKFCEFVKEHYGSINSFFRNRGIKELGTQLASLKIGFGNETRDCVLLYAANLPVFIADAYARKLLNILGLATSNNYDDCQALWEEGIKRDFSYDRLDSIVKEYTREELKYALCNSPAYQDISLVLLYQQIHAGIVELGISGRWDEFKIELESGKRS